jgi:hypothetical protein
MANTVTHIIAQHITRKDARECKMTSFAREGSDNEQSLSSLRSSSCIHEEEGESDEEEGESHEFTFKTPLEKHMVKLFSLSLSDISLVSVVSDNARTTVSPPQVDPSSRLLRGPAFSKSLSDRNLLSPKSRLCRWSSEAPTSNRPSPATKTKTTKGKKSSSMVDQMTADLSRWKNHAPRLQNSDSVLMRPERTTSSSSLSSTNSSTCFSDLEDEIPTPVPSGEDF